MKFNVAKCHTLRVTRHKHHKHFFSTIHYTTKLWKMCSRQKTLVSQSLITWIGASMSQKSLPKQQIHLVSFAGTWQAFEPKSTMEVSRGAKIRNRYNQVPHMTQDTNRKVTNSQLDTTNESQEVSPFPAGDHKAHINRYI